MVGYRVDDLSIADLRRLIVGEVSVDRGMLWFDNDAKSDLQSKVKKAADYYRNKYGRAPNLCYVHPSMIQEEQIKTGDISVCPNQTIIPNHFWIGVHFKSSAGL